MAKTNIEWTDESLNPIKARSAEGRVGWHCEVISPGCKNCYSQQKNKGFFNLGTGLPFIRQSREEVEIFLDEETLLQPLRWRKPRKIFVCSMTDWMGEWVPDEWIDKMLAVAALCPQHTFQFLTKRAERLPRYFGNPESIERIAKQFLAIVKSQHMTSAMWAGCTLPNVWLGVSVEDQKTADERIPHLLQTPAAVRFVSAEPLLGPIDFLGIGGDRFGWGRIDSLNGLRYVRANQTEDGCEWETESITRLDQVIVGGESGPHARPFNVAWARGIVKQCKSAGVSVFMKQMGAHVIITKDTQPWKTREIGYDCENIEGRVFLKDKKGGDITEWPDDLKIREFPEVSNAR